MGAIDEDTFVKAFNDVPSVQIFSIRQLQEQMAVIQETIADTSKDWNKRTDAVSALDLFTAVGPLHNCLFGFS